MNELISSFTVTEKQANSCSQSVSFKWAMFHTMCDFCPVKDTACCFADNRTQETQSYLLIEFSSHRHRRVRCCGWIHTAWAWTLFPLIVPIEIVPSAWRDNIIGLIIDVSATSPSSSSSYSAPPTRWTNLNVGRPELLPEFYFAKASFFRFPVPVEEGCRTRCLILCRMSPG